MTKELSSVNDKDQRNCCYSGLGWNHKTLLAISGLVTITGLLVLSHHEMTGAYMVGIGGGAFIGAGLYALKPRLQEMLGCAHQQVENEEPEEEVPNNEGPLPPEEEPAPKPVEAPQSVDPEQEAQIQWIRKFLETSPLKIDADDFLNSRGLLPTK
jgi:hypothetical protein